MVIGDESRLQQVFWNLLSNAVKFTPAGGLVSIHSLDQNGHVSIVITDTGSGISDDFLPHVFDRFSQGRFRDGLRGGPRLGLALVREIVHAHSGAVSAASAGDGLGQYIHCHVARRSRRAGVRTRRLDVRVPKGVALAARDRRPRGRRRSRCAASPDAAPRSARRQRPERIVIQ
jgi:signal transduction histidine kinase